MLYQRFWGATFLTFSIGAAGAFGQSTTVDSFVGSWMGELKAGALSLRIGFTISLSDGVLSAIMASPDQGVMALPVSRIDAKGDSISLEVMSAGGSYSGKLSPDGASIDGVWTQAGSSFPVLLKRLTAAPVLDRPQEPKPPFPYASIEVTIADTKANVELAGTLTLPRGTGPFPGVVLVTGSGPQNRDEELMGHKPFLVIADYLTRSGIAVLRYDDRGIGASKGDFGSATTLDFADDAQAAFTLLAARKEVDPKRIGIAGHSEGGLVAAIVAARDPAVAFIILLAGPGLPGNKLLELQNGALARASGLDDRIIDWSIQLNRKLYAIAMKQGNVDALKAEATASYLDAIEANPVLSQEEKDAAKAKAAEVIAPLLTPWFRTFLALDPATYLSEVKVPVLALNGSKDLQVLADPNLSAIRTALAAADNSRVRLLKLEGLNHLFQHAGTGLPDEYGKLTETFALEALSAMRDWILGQ